MIILIILAFGAIVLFEAPGLIQKRYWKELVVFSVLLSIGFVLSILMAIGVQLPNVSTAITHFIKGILK